MTDSVSSKFEATATIDKAHLFQRNTISPYYF